jgi:hypothetical protein
MKRRKSGTFVIPKEVLKASKEFKDATITCVYPNMQDRLAIVDSLREDSNSIFALYVLSVCIDSVDGLKYDDGADVALEYGNTHKGVKMLDGDLVMELTDEKIFNELSLYIFNEIFVSEEEKKS